MFHHILHRIGAGAGSSGGGGGQNGIVTLPNGPYTSISAVGGTIHLRVGLLYTGTLVFSYQVCDTTGLCSQATVRAKFTLGL